MGFLCHNFQCEKCHEFFTHMKGLKNGENENQKFEIQRGPKFINLRYRGIRTIEKSQFERSDDRTLEI